MINKKFEHLNKLEDGWHDGYGKKPSLLSIELGTKIMESLNNFMIEKALVFPLDSENGGVFIEWFNNEYAISIDIDSYGKTNFCYLNLLEKNDYFDIELEYENFDHRMIAKNVIKYVDKHTII